MRVTSGRNTLSFGTIVDRLGRVKAEIADLEEKEETYRQQLIDSIGEDGEAEGRLFRCTVSTAPRTKVDYEAVVDKLEQTPRIKRLIRKFTKTKPVTTVKVVSR